MKRSENPSIGDLIETMFETNKERAQFKANLYSLFDSVAHAALVMNQRVQIPGNGVFYRATRKARRIRNPTGGDPIQLPTTISLGFWAGRARRGTK